ncbi:MAG: UDP-N-acetylmuramate--L-alanine ligase [Erysipelotrichaceae bacterium]
MVYHFIGIKGSGMASLANILADKGEIVSGSDIPKDLFTQKSLEEKGIKITDFNKNNIKDGMNVIIGNAFDDTNVEVKEALANKTVNTTYYFEFLGKFINNYKTISVAGTHGKTTTTGILTHVLQQVAPTGFLIGDGTGGMPLDAKYFTLESCEFQRHFMAYKPTYAIITSVDLDHVDCYPTLKEYAQAFEDFANQVKDCVILFGDDETLRELKIKTKHIYYGFNEGNDVRIINYKENEDGMKFDVEYLGAFYGSFELPFVGKHLAWNALSTIAIAILEGLKPEEIEIGLQTFPGVKRRFSIEKNKDNVYIDDYAHHPTAIKLTIDAARTKFPNKKLVAIFKPDRYSRLEYFLDDFAEALATADEVYLCNFASNQVREPGITVTIEDLANKIKNAKIIDEDEAGAKCLATAAPACYLFMSSKDIYKLKNIVKSFH